MSKLHFANPEFLFLLLLLPVIGAWYWWKLRHKVAALRVADTSYFGAPGLSWRIAARYLLVALRLMAITLIIIAIARPQSNLNRQDISVEGIDIILASDISSSMLAQDLRPNRLEATRDVGIEFISGRPQDRIGLVVFSGEAYTQCPLTTNHASLINLYKSVNTGQIDDGTAIGDGLATAINRLKESKAKSKVIILLTDGMNNKGAIEPSDAAEIAAMNKIRIYTIGAGTMGYAPYPMSTPLGVQMVQVEVQIDEPLLRKIASITHGKYFRATNNVKLHEIYQEIDKLEKTRIDVTEFSRKKEEYLPFAWWALVLLALEFLLKNLIIKPLNE